MTQTPNQATVLDPATQASMVRALLDTLSHHPRATAQEIELSRQAAAISFAALHPRNAAEAILAVRYLALHNAMMDALRRAAQPDLPDAMVLRCLGRAVALGRLADKAEKELVASQKRQPAEVTAVPVPEARPEPAREETATAPVAAHAPIGESAPAAAMGDQNPAQPAPPVEQRVTRPAIFTPRAAARPPLRASLTASTSIAALLGRPVRAKPAFRVPTACAA